MRLLVDSRQRLVRLHDRKVDDVAGAAHGVELLSIGFVARSRKHKDFYHFAVSEYGNPTEHALCPHGWQLIGLYDGGKKWWVVGYLDKLPPECRSA